MLLTLDRTHQAVVTVKILPRTHELQQKASFYGLMKLNSTTTMQENSGNFLFLLVSSNRADQTPGWIRGILLSWSGMQHSILVAGVHTAVAPVRTALEELGDGSWLASIIRAEMYREDSPVMFSRRRARRVVS